MEIRSIKTRSFALLSVAALAVSFVGVSAFGTGVASAKKAPPPTTFTAIGAQTVSGQLLQIPTEDKALCAPYGINVNEEVGTTSASLAALANGTEYAYSTVASTFEAVAQGTLSSVVVLAYAGGPPWATEGIFAPPSVKKASQLAGKTLGGVLGIPDDLTGPLLKAAGLSPGSYNIVNFTNISAYYAADANGEDAASWATEPLVSSLQSAGWHNIAPVTSKYGFATGDWVVGNLAWVTTHPRVIENFLRCMAASINAGRSSKASVRTAVAKAISTFEGQPMSFGYETIPDYPNAAGLQPVNPALLTKDFTFVLGTKVSEALVKSIIRPQYLKATGINIAPKNSVGKSLA